MSDDGEGNPSPRGPVLPLMSAEPSRVDWPRYRAWVFVLLLLSLGATVAALRGGEGKPAAIRSLCGEEIEWALAHGDPWAALVRLLPGVGGALARLARAGYLLVVVTNQAGIGRGYYDEAAFEALTRWMLDRFAAEGAPIDRVYYCPHHPEAALDAFRRECHCRKPGPGMIEAACSDLALDPATSMLVGDRAGDLEAGGQGNRADVADMV